MNLNFVSAIRFLEIQSLKSDEYISFRLKPVKMPRAKSKTEVGLGNTLMNDRFGKGKGSDRKRGTAVTRINHATGEEV